MASQSSYGGPSVCVWARCKARLDVWSMTGVNYESVCLSVSHRQTTDNGLVASVSVSNVEIEFRQLGTFFFFFLDQKNVKIRFHTPERLISIPPAGGVY